MQKSKEPYKILYIHGLESRPGGSKDLYLQQHFQKVCAPDMEMSIYRLSRKNSVIRNIFRLALFRLWLAFCFGIAIALYSQTPLLTFAVIPIVAVTFLLLRKTLGEKALAKSIRDSVTLQKSAIETFQPDIVVGSSWGGAIALICVGQGIYKGPLLLIAPALEKVLKKVHPSDYEKWHPHGKITPEVTQQIFTIHGDKDDVVPLEDSIALEKNMGIRLKIYLGGDHRLNGSVIDNQDGEGKSLELKNLLLDLVKK